VCDWDQVGRRLNEQLSSGNVERTPGGFRLTPQGAAFMRTARMISQLFGGDPRFVGLERPIDEAARKNQNRYGCGPS